MAREKTSVSRFLTVNGHTWACVLNLEHVVRVHFLQDGADVYCADGKSVRVNLADRERLVRYLDLADRER